MGGTKMKYIFEANSLVNASISYSGGGGGGDRRNSAYIMRFPLFVYFFSTVMYLTKKWVLFQVKKIALLS